MRANPGVLLLVIGCFTGCAAPKKTSRMDPSQLTYAQVRVDVVADTILSATLIDSSGRRDRCPGGATQSPIPGCKHAAGYASTTSYPHQPQYVYEISYFIKPVRRENFRLLVTAPSRRTHVDVYLEKQMAWPDCDTFDSLTAGRGETIEWSLSWNEAGRKPCLVSLRRVRERSPR